MLTFLALVSSPIFVHICVALVAGILTAAYSSPDPDPRSRFLGIGQGLVNVPPATSYRELQWWIDRGLWRAVYAAAVTVVVYPIIAYAVWWNAAWFAFLLTGMIVGLVAFRVFPGRRIVVSAAAFWAYLVSVAGWIFVWAWYWIVWALQPGRFGGGVIQTVVSSVLVILTSGLIIAYFFRVINAILNEGKRSLDMDVSKHSKHLVCLKEPSAFIAIGKGQDVEHYYGDRRRVPKPKIGLPEGIDIFDHRTVAMWILTGNVSLDHPLYDQLAQVDTGMVDDRAYPYGFTTAYKITPTTHLLGGPFSELKTPRGFGRFNVPGLPTTVISLAPRPNVDFESDWLPTHLAGPEVKVKWGGSARIILPDRMFNTADLEESFKDQAERFSAAIVEEMAENVYGRTGHFGRLEQVLPPGQPGWIAPADPGHQAFRLLVHVEAFRLAVLADTGVLFDSLTLKDVDIEPEVRAILLTGIKLWNAARMAPQEARTVGTVAREAIGAIVQAAQAGGIIDPAKLADIVQEAVRFYFLKEGNASAGVMSAILMGGGGKK